LLARGVFVSCNYKREWVKKNGPIPSGFHLHHVVPRFAGGTNDVTNLVCMNRDDHAAAHLKRYEEFGDRRDLCSYYLIIGDITRAHQEISSLGGSIAGRNQVRTNKGIHTLDKELRREWVRLGAYASNNFSDVAEQRARGSRGGPKNKGFVWLNDGVNETKYTLAQQESCSVEELMLLNSSLRQGRIPPDKVSCPFCPKVGNPGGMGKWHFDKCKSNPSRSQPKY
jgi:hypothetical protein